MHIVFGRYLKYILWFVFAVILGSFLIGYAKFGFNTRLYIDYLNGMDAKQLFQGSSQSGESLSDELTGSVDISGVQDVYDPSLDADFFGQTGVQATGKNLTGTDTTTESFGFVKNSENTGETVQAKPAVEAKGTVVSTGSNNTSGSVVSDEAARKKLLDLIKSKEK